MKKVLLKSGVMLCVSDERAAGIMCALRKNVDSDDTCLNDDNGDHEGFVRLNAIDAVIDADVTFE